VDQPAYFDSSEFPKVLTLILELSQYPILAPEIRERMRQELFKRGVVGAEAFEAEVREKAIQSQAREGISDPIVEENPEAWRERMRIVRDNLTDFYFAYNLPHDVFEDLVRQTLATRLPSESVVLTFHPELAPWDMLFAQGEAYEDMTTDARSDVSHHLLEIKVVLIKAMISDHLDYVGLAKHWLSIGDLKRVRSRRIGRGKIGGKAGGIMLAEAILRKSSDQDFLERFHTPASWFLGADVFYSFTHYNDLLDFANQKYRQEDEIRDDYPSIRNRFRQGRFPDDIVADLQDILDQIGPSPLIVRSSSLLEDSFGFSFAGKYESYFCGNQGTPDENLQDLLQAIALVYASVYSPDVLMYRRSKGLLDYDERMAVLIQEVKGRTEGGYYMPDVAGVALSRNQYRWSPQFDRDAGFLRLVWGLGTRAVDQVGGDYPRLVALSHPGLRPEKEPRRIHQYSQHAVDLIDLEQNKLQTLPITEVVAKDTPFLRWLAQRYDQEVLDDFLSTPIAFDPNQVVFTFDNLLRRTDFPKHLRYMLKTLELYYNYPVDIEFLAIFDEDDQGNPDPSIYLLQCRPQVYLKQEHVELPSDIPERDQLFVSTRMIPDGVVENIRYLVYISPERYDQNTPAAKKHALARVIGRLNNRLADTSYILLGPGRWGSDNPDLGIPVTYGDIYNAQALIEISADQSSPQPSYGTHFFQDLVEANIYILAIDLDDPECGFNQDYFERAPNSLSERMPDSVEWDSVLKLIDVPQTSDGRELALVMDGDRSRAVAFFNAPTG
jgi:hypothetical protein